MRADNKTTELSTRWANLADAALGAEALYATDEFFAAKERMLSSAEPVFDPDKYDDHGQWMDGWESRRKRGPGHDHCIVRLATRGHITAVDIDTRHFTGNYPPQASIDATNDSDPTNDTARWTQILSTVGLQGDCGNLFDIDSDQSWECLRLNIYPDGGVARLRVFGRAQPDWSEMDRDEIVDLAATLNGGQALETNDAHFGDVQKMLRPGRGINMGDGWQTQRRREPGHDWAIVELGHAGIIKQVEIDTAHFKGNYPESVSIDSAFLDSPAEGKLAARSIFWQTLLPLQPLGPDAQHVFDAELVSDVPATHVRINIHPDGGLSRVRLNGKLYRP